MPFLSSKMHKRRATSTLINHTLKPYENWQINYIYIYHFYDNFVKIFRAKILSKNQVVLKGSKNQCNLINLLFRASSH